MSTIKQRMTALKNKYIFRMSKVGEIQPAEQEAVKKVKNAVTPSAYYNFLGKTEQKVEKEASVRKIKNGKDDYLVADGTTSLRRQIFFGDPRNIDPALVDTTFRHIAVMYQDKIVSISIAANNTIEEGDIKVPERCICFDDSRSTRVDLNARTDIYDTNAIRYQIKDNKEMANFFDKFIIVTPEERKAYQKYESQKEQEAALLKKQQEQEKLAAQRKAKQDAAQKAAAEAARKEERRREEIRQKKLRERFLGK